LLRVLGRLRVVAPPQSWLDLLRSALTDADVRIRCEAIAAAKMRDLVNADRQLKAISQDKTLPPAMRVAACECYAPRLRQLPADEFEFLLASANEPADPFLRLTAARTLGACRLERSQLLRLSDWLAKADGTTGFQVLKAFTRTNDEAVGRAFVESLKSSAVTSILTTGDVQRLLAGFSGDVVSAASALQARLADRQAGQPEPIPSLGAGDARRGQAVFFAAKTNCASCHRAAGRGSSVGPNLSRIGFLRDRSEIVESIVRPSAYVAPEFRCYVVNTSDGRSFAGIVDRETASQIFLRTAGGIRQPVPRNAIEEITISAASLMPEGLEKSMSPQELADLVEFLSRLR
jgi:putative heme-binding domain-containing protein